MASGIFFLFMYSFRLLAWKNTYKYVMYKYLINFISYNPANEETVTTELTYV